MTKMYYDKDADLSLLKDKTIAILGYGSQGHAQAQNLRDSGCKVIVGQRPGSANYDLAVSHGFKPVLGRRGHRSRATWSTSCCPTKCRATSTARSIRPQPEAGQHPDVLARLQHPFRPGRSRRRASTPCWSRPRARATWCAASSRTGAASPA